jgi:hypothetical protein
MIPDHGNFLHVQFPSEWGDPPTYFLGQRIRLNGRDTGTVFGLDYVALGSWEHHQNIQLGWHYKVSWDKGCPRATSHPVELCHETELQPLAQTVHPSYAELATV